jgi:hypothetical protein
MQTFGDFTDEQYTPETDPTGLKDFQRSELAISINSRKMGALIVKMTDERMKKDPDWKYISVLKQKYYALNDERNRIYSGDAAAQLNCIKHSHDD